MFNKNDNGFINFRRTINRGLNIICNNKFLQIVINGSLKTTLIIKIVEIILLILILYIIFRGHFIIYNKNHIDYKALLEQNYESINIAYNNSINFIKTCQSPDLIHFEPSKIYNFSNPYISVIIPLFNCEKFILRSIKSVQLQNLTNFEILLIDDNSVDNTYNLVTKIHKEDKRIKILKNQKNMGTLYSRSIGVLMSQGKYIFNLDNDDLFLNNDILSSISQINEKGNFDIVEFKSISNKIIDQDILINKIKNSMFSHQKPFILFQPELGMFPIPTGNRTGSYGLRDIFLWGKCIKTKIYQKAINHLGYERYTRLMIRYEDILTNYMLFNTAESFIYIEKYGIYHFVRSGSGYSVGRRKVTRNTNILYLVDIVIDFSLNYINNKKLASYLVIYYFKLKRFEQTLLSSKYNMDLFISCIRRVLNSTYISENNKKEIRSNLKKFKFIPFHEL